MPGLTLNRQSSIPVGSTRVARVRRVTQAVAVGLIASFVSTMAVAEQLPPTERNTLLSWLQAGKYKSWAHESGPHASAGPHPVQVVAYLNQSLDTSMAAGNKAHPKGAAAVKELLDAGGKLSGWAVSVKTEADSANGKGWYWYEILGTDAGGRVVADGNGVPLCFGCHTPGKDYVLIPYPLK